MRRIGIALTVLVLVFTLNAQTSYYVSLTGSDANTGVSEAQAWRTITFAASASSPVVAGDTVYVKAGDYGAEHIDVLVSGTAGHSIVFEGYRATPGDSPNLNYTFGDPVDAGVMPLLDGANRATAGTAFSLYDQQYVVLKNIQITNYEMGIDIGNAQNSSFENIIATQLGDFNDGYDGRGFVIHGDVAGTGSNNTLKDCIVSNACAEGISITGDNNTLENCKIYCDEDNTVYASMDYYIVLAGNDNHVNNCYIERIGDLAHGGAGIGIKEYGQNNLIENCTAKNLKNGGFYVRWAAVKNNEFRNCTAVGTLDDVNGFLIREGASDNVFNACVSDNCSSAIRFAVNGEDASYCGRNNTFNNCLIKNSIWAIEFGAWEIVGVADSNSFANCIFYKSTNLFDSARENNNNSMVNCIVKDVGNLSTGAETLNFQYTYTDFYNNGFATPSGTGNISDNPQFVDENTGDFHLQTGSACIDAGTSTGAPLTDFEGTARPQGNGFDMGIFEAQAPLMVDYLTSLQAVQQGERVLLTWQSAMENNNAYFELERSTDAIDWEKINHVKGMGNSQIAHTYRVIDATHLAGLLFYRLKQVDFDGSYTYSDITSVFVATGELKIYPNPTNGRVHVPHQFLNKPFKIMDYTGRIIQKGIIQSDIIDWSNLTSGAYLLQIIDGNVIGNYVIRVRQ